MGINERCIVASAPIDKVQSQAAFGLFMVRTGLIRSNDLIQGLVKQSGTSASLGEILVSQGIVSGSQIDVALAEFFHIKYVTLSETPPDPALFNLLAPHFMLKFNVLPWKKDNGVISVATDDPIGFNQIRSLFPNTFMPVVPVVASRESIQKHIAQNARSALTKQASSRVEESESCRNWKKMSAGKFAFIVAVLLLIFAITIKIPVIIFTALVLWASITLVVAIVLKILAFYAHLTEPGSESNDFDTPIKTPLPKVSILVPLFKEDAIAKALIGRLSRLTYPKALLDVVLVVEENDDLTRETLAAIALPHWMRIVEVPEGGPKTKPRAMNYALDFCDGDIIGIWDAEDAPDPDQVTKIALRFLNSPQDVACLQGILDYYNPRQNWLSRCFTIEYAAWFRVMLPGMSRLGFAIPLGGTTLFFRRNALEELGGWDAHNVTEDADLGFRLARHGYRTEMIKTVTGEEANCHALPWIRQRSRWLKGYMVTYLVHMRSPKMLYQQLGARKFWGFQAHFITALSQFFLAPFLWSFWLILFGLPHPLNGIIPHHYLLAFGALFLTAEIVNLSVSIHAVSGPKHRHLLKWTPTLHFYYPLGVFAAYKALYELIFTPFYWDKTNHGHSLIEIHDPQPSSPESLDFAAHGIELKSRNKSGRNMAL